MLGSRMLVGDLSDDLVLFRLEAYDYNMFRPHGHLGTVRVSVDYLRKMCPTLPRNIMTQSSFRSRIIQFASTPADPNRPAPALSKVTSRWFGTSVSELAKDTEETKEDEEEDPVGEVVTTPDHLQEEAELFSKSKKRSKKLTNSTKSNVNQSAKPGSSERRKGLVQAEFFGDAPAQIPSSSSKPPVPAKERAPSLSLLSKSSKSGVQSIGKLSKQDSNLIDVVRAGEDDDADTKLNIMRSIKSLKMRNIRTAVSSWWTSFRSSKKVDE